MSMHSGNSLEVITFKDGDFGSNDPSEEAHHDVANKHGGISKKIGPLFSIGTGSIPVTMLPG